MDTTVAKTGPAPFSLRDAPALIERIFPAQKIGIESQKERKANAGQTLTALGSYWKGRKPLVLVRACVLASLLPATDDPVRDLEIFEALMGLDERAMARRLPKVTATMVWNCPLVPAVLKEAHLVVGKPNDGEADDGAGVSGLSAKWRSTDVAHLPTVAERRAEKARIVAERENMRERAFRALSFGQKVAICERVEKIEDISKPGDPFYTGIWAPVNAHLGTSVSTIPELVEQLGIARFGHRPVIGDPFCGGGSIPFEAARTGCGVVASDLNPVAAMLTWGALNIIGADEDKRREIAAEQRRIADAVDAEITLLRIEHNEQDDRAKAYLYCLETVDPQTGWMVPMAPSWVVSADRKCVGQLVPDYATKRFEISIKEGATADEMTEAELGTLRDEHLVYDLAPIEGGEIREWRIPIARLRGDGEGPLRPDGSRRNRLRQWEASDFEPRRPDWISDAPPVLTETGPGAWVGGDIWLERLYCIQWLDGSDLKAGKSRPQTHFAAPTEADLERERKVARQVTRKLAEWQAKGLVSDMRIEPGDKTDEPIRTRGWTHWHQLFGSRSILLLASLGAQCARSSERSMLTVAVARALDYCGKLCRWDASPANDKIANTFSNQAINTLANWGVRGWSTLNAAFSIEWRSPGSFPTIEVANTTPATSISFEADNWIYDPPYADAVVYHEITEFFIAWLRKNPPPPFDQWSWDSRRPLAIQGKGDKFRADMVAALRAMADHMPDVGLQVCMFTHKDAGVWADMAQIVWAAGLQVTAAWYVSTETASELKKGGYVQGTVLLVLRRRKGDEHGYRSDIVPEVRARVAAQAASLTGMNQRVRAGGRDENLFSDADIQMAGYAAALEVLTSYTHIDGIDMTREALRPREAGGRGKVAAISIVEEMILLAVQTANESMLPEGLGENLWERLNPAERFYLKMTEAEANWPAGAVGGKLDDYQTFAKAYRAESMDDLMASTAPNRARLKSASEFRGGHLEGHPISGGALRPTLYAVMGLASDAAKNVDPKTSGELALHGLRDRFGDADWLRVRDNVRGLSVWLGRVWERRNPGEAGAARVLASLIASERL